MPRKIIIATLMREQGETGVQTHFNTFKNYLDENEKEVEAIVITPFSFYKLLVVPVFGLRKIIDKLSGEWSVWWYRYWHYLFLKQVLIKQLAECDRLGIPTVIYAQCPLSAKAALEARVTEGQKVIMIVHFNVSEADEWAEKEKINRARWLYDKIKRTEKEVIPKLDGIIYVSNFMKHTLINNIRKVEQVKQTIIPYFVIRSNFKIKPEIMGDLINIGTLEPRKNQAYLLGVLAAAKQMGKRYSLTLVGNGQDRLKLELLAQSLDIDKQVNFLGFQLNAAQFLPQHRVYVHSAIMDNLPISLLEAMAYNLPIIAGAIGGIPEIFSDGIEGIYWPLDSPILGAENLITLMENPEIYHQMAQATEKRFSSNFAPIVVASRLLSFLG